MPLRRRLRRLGGLPSEAVSESHLSLDGGGHYGLSDSLSRLQKPRRVLLELPPTFNLFVFGEFRLSECLQLFAREESFGFVDVLFVEDVY
jgi:hypothetical protein